MPTDDLNNKIINTSRLRMNLISSEGNIDSPDGFICKYFVNAKGSLPTILDGNQWVVISQNLADERYNSQIAFGFGSTSIAVRIKYNSDSWGTWKKIT